MNSEKKIEKYLTLPKNFLDKKQIRIVFYSRDIIQKHYNKILCIYKIENKVKARFHTQKIPTKVVFSFISILDI